MGLYIKGSAMPETCGECCLLACEEVEKDEILYCAVHPKIEIMDTAQRPPSCPLVEVKTPHGRLIDADDLESKMIKTYRYFNVKFDLAEAETVIEGEDASL